MSDSGIKSFYSSVDMGDCIYSLLFAKILGVRSLYLGCDGNLNKFNRKGADFLIPLIKHQEYLSTVEIYCGQKHDYNYGDHPTGRPVILGTNLTEYHSSKFNIQYPDERVNSKWLEAPKLNNTRAKVVINRTARYHGRSDAFYKLLLSMYPFSSCVFVGLEEEHENFQRVFSLKITHKKSDAALELASIINSSDIFLGNESLACAIATGLGKTCFIETCPVAANYIFEERPNTYYF